MNNPGIALVAMIAVSLLAGGEPNRLHAQQSEESAKPCLEQKKIIDAELSQQHKVPWMGEYSKFFGTFSIAPVGGFFFLLGSDSGYWACAWGRVEVADGKLRLIPDRAVPAEGTRVLGLEWTPVTWGDRHYLIASDDLLEFVNSVNNGYEPNYGITIGSLFYKQRGDENIRVSGFPDVPEPYKQYFLAKPIRGSVTSINGFKVERIDEGRTEVRTTKVTLDVGTKQGVLVGMRFITYKPRPVMEDVVITDVFENKSEAVVRQLGKIYHEPSTKWKVSTSIRDIK